jgi:hypothetical protein
MRLLDHIAIAREDSRPRVAHKREDKEIGKLPDQHIRNSRQVVPALRRQCASQTGLFGKHIIKTRGGHFGDADKYCLERTDEKATGERIPSRQDLLPQKNPSYFAEERIASVSRAELCTGRLSHPMERWMGLGTHIAHGPTPASSFSDSRKAERKNLSLCAKCRLASRPSFALSSRDVVSSFSIAVSKSRTATL